MNDDEARKMLTDRLLAKADMALAAARREHEAGDCGLAMNRIYYACFYGACAVLTQERQQYSRHSGVRAAIHRHLVKTGRLAVDLGRFYDDAFDDRQEADYDATAEFDPLTVLGRIVLA